MFLYVISRELVQWFLQEDHYGNESFKSCRVYRVVKTLRAIGLVRITFLFDNDDLLSIRDGVPVWCQGDGSIE